MPDLILVGPAGVGKSTLGRELAARCGRELHAPSLESADFVRDPQGAAALLKSRTLQDLATEGTIVEVYASGVSDPDVVAAIVEASRAGSLVVILFARAEELAVRAGLSAPQIAVAATLVPRAWFRSHLADLEESLEDLTAKLRGVGSEVVFLDTTRSDAGELASAVCSRGGCLGALTI